MISSCKTFFLQTFHIQSQINRKPAAMDPPKAWAELESALNQVGRARGCLLALKAYDDVIHLVSHSVAVIMRSY
eukprot:m.226300 g.226300  ORF g.226300 m.226300 type:complete len:74 (+) comp15169_c0_seq3:99-320(+)